MAAFRLQGENPLADIPLKENITSTIHVATARAVTPMRRPSQDRTSYTETQPLPSQRRSDLMAPKTVGFWSLIPYMAATAVVMACAWVAKKRFAARQAGLVEEFGQVLVLYGNSPETRREIVSEYKRKLGPGVLRGAMFASYLRSLVTEKPLIPSMIQDVLTIKKLLRLSDDKALKIINSAGASMQDAPSLLGKLLFIASRIVDPEKTDRLSLVPLFPYSPSTVSDLQQNMLERIYREYVNEQIDVNAIDEPPAAAATALRLRPDHAKQLFEGIVLARIRKKEREAAEIAAAAAEDASKPNTPDLDFPARSGEPAKAAVHAYQCGDCGYTLFPAAGREFKFYGDEFVCPACGAPKSKFVDVNDE